MTARSVVRTALKHSGPGNEVESMPKQKKSFAPGFSLIEMLVAITVTMIIMGSVYGIMSQGQSAFGREPFLADRQQQIRIAMDRMQEDVLSAGLGLGAFAQTFATGLDNVGPQGVRPAADGALGGANSDMLEIRRMAPDCAPIRLHPTAPLAGQQVQIIEPFPAAATSSCFPDPGWVFVLFPDGRSKFGWLNNHTTNQSVFGTQPVGSQSQIAGGGATATDFGCSVWIGTTNGVTSPNGGSCPLPAALDPDPPTGCPSPMSTCLPYAIHQAELVRYRIGTDAEGTIGLFRSTTGGFDTARVPQAPPHAIWQLVASGIEDLQVEYRTTDNDWQDEPPLVPEASSGDIVLEVRVTLWARALTGPEQRVAGETRSQGDDPGGVTAIRGSLVSTIAPRAAQEALAGLRTPLWK